MTGASTQRMHYLARIAADNRMAATRLREDVQAGRLTIPEALEDPRANALRVSVLLRSVPGSRRAAATRALDRAGLAGCLIVRDLDDAQRGALARGAVLEGLA